MHFLNILLLLYSWQVNTANYKKTVADTIKKERSISNDTAKSKKPVQIQNNKITIDISRPITIPELVSILASFATLITALFTYLLLLQTKKTITLTTESLDRDRRRAETEMISHVYQNFKNTYLSIVNDKDGIRLLASTHNTTQGDVKINMFGSFLINNVYEIFNLRNKGFIDDEMWEHFIFDIEDFFQYPFIKERWEKIKSCYPEQFDIFVTQFVD